MNYLEVYFNGVLKHSLSIKMDDISIGRTSSNDLVIDNMGVSSYHAVISKKDEIYYIEDLNSTNGTFLNSEKISSRQRISPKDAVVIGKHTLKLSEWSHTNNAPKQASLQESDDATVIINNTLSNTINKLATSNPEQKQFYLIVKGELTGKNKILLTESNYGIGKAKDNALRIKGWFSPAYIAEIEKIGHSFYISPLKKKKVKLNGNPIDSSILLSPLDEIRIKGLFIKFFTD